MASRRRYSCHHGTEREGGREREREGEGERQRGAEAERERDEERVVEKVR